ncbi:hypothetical protein YC2023_022151 [Brassica napus]
MGMNNTRILITVLALVLTAAIMIQETKSIPLCNVDTNDLQKCRPAVTGNYPPPPTPACCTVAKTANLECLCPFLSRSGIDPSKLKALLANCGTLSFVRTDLRYEVEKVEPPSLNQLLCRGKKTIIRSSSQVQTSYTSNKIQRPKPIGSREGKNYFIHQPKDLYMKLRSPTFVCLLTNCTLT